MIDDSDEFDGEYKCKMPAYITAQLPKCFPNLCRTLCRTNSPTTLTSLVRVVEYLYIFNSILKKSNLPLQQRSSLINNCLKNTNRPLRLDRPLFKNEKKIIDYSHQAENYSLMVTKVKTSTTSPTRRIIFQYQSEKNLPIDFSNFLFKNLSDFTNQTDQY